ncbi:MAG: glycosyltransferase family 61 protein [Niveispirillum sp.]|nr:glycosyltransferase family 61 protein [Niveispirillum sp.]
MKDAIKIPAFVDQGEPREALPAAHLEAVLALSMDELRQNPLYDTGRGKVAQVLASLGHLYEAKICQAGSLVPLLGRDAFASDGPTFSVHDADAGHRGVTVLPAPPPFAPVGKPQSEKSPFVAVLEQGRCAIGPLGYAVFARDGSYAVDFCRNDGPLMACHSTGLPPPVRMEGTVAVIPNAWGNAVFHWLLESIPRVRMLSWAGIPFSEIDKIIFRAVDDWHLEALDLLGVPRSKVFFTNTHHIEADRLIICADVEDYDYHVIPPSVRPAPWIAQSLYDLVPDESPVGAGGGGRLYISRANATWRRMRNEDEITGFLQARGFRVVHFEQMSLREKAAALREASVIVSPVGAGLAHIPLARPGTHVVIFYPDDFMTPTFSSLCEDRKIHHWGAVSPSLERYYPAQMRTTTSMHRDMLVDLSVLGRILDQIDETLTATG